MKPDVLRRAMMAAVCGIALGLMISGLFLDKDELMVAGLLNALVYCLWAYGRTLHRP